jgi:hypothetical protein
MTVARPLSKSTIASVTPETRLRTRVTEVAHPPQVIPETKSAIPLALSDGFLSMGFLLLPANWNEDGVSPYWKVKPLPANFVRAAKLSRISEGRTLGPA